MAHLEFGEEKLEAGFFERGPVNCARELIGTFLHWRGCVGRIVETEAYLAEGDAACHTWNRPSARDFVENQPAGMAYVYLNYGMHWLFNVLVKGEAGAGFVLLRALEPVRGIATMEARRNGVRGSILAAGPGRLTKAMGIDGTAHGQLFLDVPGCGLTYGPKVKVCAGGRIGISKARENPWRFGDPSSPALSRKF